MLRHGARRRGVGVPQAPVEGARTVRAGRHPSQQGELPSHLRRRPDRRRLSGRRVVWRMRSARPRANHPGTSHRRTGRRGAVDRTTPARMKAQLFYFTTLSVTPILITSPLTRSVAAVNSRLCPSFSTSVLVDWNERKTGMLPTVGVALS